MSDGISPTLPTGLGFGCAYLTGGWETARSRRLIDIAYDSGFRHYDVAPLYGIGTAEDALGSALAGRRAQVTIATKVGRPRPHLSTSTQLVRFLSAPVRGALRGLRKPPAKKPNTVGDKPAASSLGDFSLNHVQNSIHESLRRLRTDYVDFFLLHEVQAEQINDDLIGLLQTIRQQGKCRTFGLATSFDATTKIISAYPNNFDVIQYSWSVLDLEQATLTAPHGRILHRAIMRAYQPMLDWLRSDPSARSRLSDYVGTDLSDPLALSSILLGAAVHHNPGGLVLMGTRRAQRIPWSMATATDRHLVAKGGRLIEALRNESHIPRPA